MSKAFEEMKRIKELRQKGKGKKDFFNLEFLKKHLRESGESPDMVERSAKITLNNMGYKDEEEYEVALVAHMRERAKNEISDEGKAYISDLETICKNAALQIAPEFKREYILQVEKLKSQGTPSLKAKEIVKIEMANRLGQKLFYSEKEQLKRQLATFKENYDVADDYLDDVNEICEMFGLNVPQAVERLERERISEEREYDEGIRSQLGIGDEDDEDSDDEYESEDNYDEEPNSEEDA
jgi:hypothetical protein